MTDDVDDDRQTFRLQHPRAVDACRHHVVACVRHHVVDACRHRVLVCGLCFCLQVFELLAETLFQSQAVAKYFHEWIFLLS